MNLSKISILSKYRFYTGQRAKILDSPVKYRTPGNPISTPLLLRLVELNFTVRPCLLCISVQTNHTNLDI